MVIAFSWGRDVSHHRGHPAFRAIEIAATSTIK